MPTVRALLLALGRRGADARARRRPTALVIIVSLVLVGLGGTALGHWLDPTRRITLEGLTRQPPFAVPDFTLVDAERRPLARRELLGHVWVADFVFLQCGNTCATLNRRFFTLERRVAGAANARFVSFSVDPEDGPAVLARYRRAWDRRHDPRWRLLVADDQTFPKLAVGLGLAAAEADVPAAFLATSRYMFLVDRDGIVRGTYDGLDDDAVDRLGDDLAALVEAGG